MTGEMVLAAILTTIAIGILLRGLIVLVWSASEQHPLPALGFTNPSLPFSAARAFPPCGADRRHDRPVYGGLFAFLRFGPGGCACAQPGKIRCWRRSAGSICMPSTPLPGASRP